jgi:hypothetical protein
MMPRPVDKKASRLFVVEAFDYTVYKKHYLIHYTLHITFYRHSHHGSALVP